MKNSNVPATIEPPKHSIAFKEDATAIVKIHDIVWSISRHGRLTPTFILEEPVDFNGTTVTKATADNAARLKKEGIGKGALVIIRHSGDSIPNVEMKLEDGESP